MRARKWSEKRGRGGEDTPPREAAGGPPGRGEAEGLLLEPSDALRDLPAVRVAIGTASAVCHGAVFPAPLLGIDPAATGPHRVLDSGGRLLAVYRVEGRAARPEVVVG